MGNESMESSGMAQGRSRRRHGKGGKERNVFRGAVRWAAPLALNPATLIANLPISLGGHPGDLLSLELGCTAWKR